MGWRRGVAWIDVVMVLCLLPNVYFVWRHWPGGGWSWFALGVIVTLWGMTRVER
jgi:hypothetical protein